jgi:hypothetical protein
MDAAPLKTKTARSETLGGAFRATGIRRCNHLNTFKYTPQKKKTIYDTSSSSEFQTELCFMAGILKEMALGNLNHHNLILLQEKGGKPDWGGLS